MANSNPTQLPEGVPVDELDGLYGLPLDEFTAGRDALAKELRAAGQRDEAAWVKALRKPSTAAWLVNQLARTQKTDAKRVLDAGEALRAAQDRILAGKGNADELARATEEHAGAMRALLARAPGLLDPEGASPSAATLDRAAETLRAIPLDEEARAGFAVGRLTREHRASGLGLVPTHETPPAAGERSRGRVARDKTRRAEQRAAAANQKAAAEQKARARAALDTAKARHRAQVKEVAELDRAARRAEREADSAQRRLDKAAAALDGARARQAEAQARLAEAEAAVKRLR